MTTSLPLPLLHLGLVLFSCVKPGLIFFHRTASWLF